MSGMIGCLAALAEVFFTAGAAMADMITGSSDSENHGRGWVISFLVAIVTLVILIALFVHLSN